MSSEDENDFEFYAEEIQEKRRLPYSLIVEKIEGDIIFTQNQWGNAVKYKHNIVKDNFDIITDTED